MNPLDNNEECDFAKYFKNLGYEYSWDFDSSYRWHELAINGNWFIQIEMVPLDKIIKDMCTIEDVEIDYFASLRDKKAEKYYKELCEKVREFEENKNKPLGKMTSDFKNFEKSLNDATARVTCCGNKSMLNKAIDKHNKE